MNGPSGAAGTGDLRSLLRPHSLVSPPHGSAGAAVLIVLREGASEVEVLLIERAVRADDPASGQVGLPGGRASEADRDLAATALRESEEEVSVAAHDLAGPPHFVGFREASVFGLRVGVFAGELGPSGGPPQVRDRSEVAHVFWLPASALRTTRKIRQDTHRGQLEVEAVVQDGHVLWGFTRRVLLDFFSVPPESGT